MRDRLEFHQFGPEHFSEYKKWFSDDSIRGALGDIDESWLDYIINDRQGLEYAVSFNGAMVAEVGFVLPIPKFPHYCITNLAVNPAMRGQGIGSAVLEKLVEMHPPTNVISWLAYVEKKNAAAQLFFKKNGWAQGTPHGEDDMIPFENTHSSVAPT